MESDFMINILIVEIAVPCGVMRGGHGCIHTAKFSSVNK